MSEPSDTRGSLALNRRRRERPRRVHCARLTASWGTSPPPGPPLPGPRLPSSGGPRWPRVWQGLPAGPCAWRRSLLPAQARGQQAHLAGHPQPVGFSLLRGPRPPVTVLTHPPPCPKSVTRKKGSTATNVLKALKSLQHFLSFKRQFFKIFSLGIISNTTNAQLH